MLTGPAEAELAIQRLLDKLHRWIIQQPEALLIWTQPRAVRKRLIDLIANEIAKLPVREGTTEPNRSQRREMIRELEKADREWWKGIEQ